MNMQIVKSKRKTISIEITKELSVLVRSPQHMSHKKIMGFVEQKTAWIEEHIERMRQRIEKNSSVVKLTDEEIQSLVKKAKEIIPQRVLDYAQRMGVDYGRITIRSQRTLWGSCSSKGNLNFNCLLLLTPPEVLDYVVVHELCHLKEMNHSKRFWEELRRVLPDYEIQKKWLKDHGSELIGRLQNH